MSAKAKARTDDDAATATSLREAFRREQIEESRRAHEAFLRYDAARATGMIIPAAPGGDTIRPKPTCREVKVQEILFEHCQEIPEGIYKQLMDALVIQ